MGQQALNTRKVLSGEVLFTEGSFGKQEMYVIKEGKIELSINRGGRKVILATLAKNQFFGEMELLSAEARCMTATALCYSELQVIDVTALRQKFEAAPLLIRHILRAHIAVIKSKNEIVARQAHQQPVIPVYANLLDLMAGSEKHSRGPRFERKSEVSIPLARVLERCRQICGHSSDQALVTLKQMAKLNLISLDSGGGTRQDRWAGGKMVTVESDKYSYQDVRFNYEDIVARARQLPEEVSHEVMAHVQSEQDHIELDELAQLVAIDREILLRKLAQDEISDEIFMLRKSVALRYITEKGKEYFSKRRRITAQQLKSIMDLEFVSHRVLGEALANMELYELAKLIKTVDDPVIVERLFSVMGKAQREEIEELLADLQADPLEGSEIEDKLIATIKQITTGGGALEVA